MTRLASLGSGSKGNGTLVRLGDVCLLIDCGFPLKQTEMRLRRLNLAPGDLSAVLVTHEHADHARGVAAFAQKYGLPVFASYGTLKAAGGNLVGKPFPSYEPFEFEGVHITPVPVPHDAREPTQFVLEGHGLRIGVLSDLGHVTPHVIDCYTGCDGIMMESNHDLPMLVRGRYPQRLKQRVSSELGHLSNEQAVRFLERVAHPDLDVVIGHVSEENNHPDLLETSFGPLRDQVASLTFATQSLGFDWIDVAARPAVAV